MSNSLLTIGGITRKAIQLFRNTNAFLQMVDRQYDASFAKTGAKIGSQLRIRLPNDYVVRTGQTATPQDTTENQVTLTIATQKGVDVSFTSEDLALSMDDFSDRVLEPMINVLAGDVASDVMSGAEGIPNFVHNTSGSATIAPSAATWLQAGAVLDLYSCPRTGRNAIVDAMTMSRAVDSLKGLFAPQDDIGRQYKSGMINRSVLGFDWAMDQTVLLHTTGTFSAGTVNGANQTGSTLTVNAISGTLKKGDVITIAGVHQVNRVTKKSTGNLMQFVVTADAANGATSVSIYPALTPGAVAYATVDASPATSAAISLVNAASEIYRKNFLFHPTAVTLATADLQLPTGAVVATAREAYDGISLRMVQDYNSTTDVWLTRLDILYGYVWPRPEWACIVGDAV